MMIIRPVEYRDLGDILALAGKAGAGLTSLPSNEQVLAARIDRSVRTWQGIVARGEQGYLFVLEDSERGKVVGVSAIEVAVGLKEPWYNFRVGTLVHASTALNVYNAVPTLYLSNDHTGLSELCTLFLDPQYRHGTNGQLLVKARLMFMATFRAHFGQRVLAEMRGYCDEQGHSPFWANLGQRFFSIDFAQADYLSGTGNKAFIAELMPKHPLYVDFLAPEARAVIGRVHPQTEPARALLESEGLGYRGYIDIFDGGPTLEAEIDHIRTVRDSRQATARIAADGDVGSRQDAAWCLLANEDYQGFRAVACRCVIGQEPLEIGVDTAAALGLSPGQPLRAATLYADGRSRAGSTASHHQTGFTHAALC
ncbi:arginine N-succinyltransferase [Acerihabitans arboris]|uniref:Arginine N-succinyltransferase n=1 Tax=Acerihabitans arboris TaxID=2691583 RepID=A0A845SE18_9GAMM|nr:arginine N-succinyltransferase [Acerihabitans arboris]NDL63040.1 arginine N-succinyltransferase [Acerihabitans arboris]